MIGFGMLLGMIGPLLLIPAIWGVHRWIKRSIVPRLNARFGALPPGVPLLLSVLLVGAVLLAFYLPGRLYFESLCRAHAVPQISERVNVDGLYVTKLFPHETKKYFDQGFVFVEAPQPYKEGDVRYSRGEDGELRAEPVKTLLSRYGLREKHSQMGWTVSMTQKTVYEIATDRVIAKAGAVDYFGGPLFIFQGVYGLSYCPDILTPQGSDDFNVFYRLARLVLRDEASASPAGK